MTAAFAAIFGKMGLQGIDTNTATAIRAVIMSLFLIGLILIQGNLHEIKPLLLNSQALFYIVLSGLAGALSWLFYFLALKNANVSQVVPFACIHHSQDPVAKGPKKPFHIRDKA